MDIGDGVRDRRTTHERRPAGVGGHADRQPARVRSHEWHTGSAKETDPASVSFELDFTCNRLGELRRMVSKGATEASLDSNRTGDLVLAINELATNSVRHAGGTGTLRMWREGDTLLCDVIDRGHIQQQSVRLTPPDPTQVSGRGLWIVSQLCDLVQIRSSCGHNVVRVHMRLT